MGRKSTKARFHPARDRTRVGISSEALFRSTVVAQVQTRMLGGASRTTAIRKVANLSHCDGQGALCQVSQRTLHRWVVAMTTKGVTGLERRGRVKRPGSRSLPERFLVFALKEKTEDVGASVPELIRRGREYGHLGRRQRVSRITVYRALVAGGACMARRKGAAARDSRRFAYPHRMMIVLSDGKHFRAGATRAKRVVAFYLDDHSRFGLHAVVTPSEDTMLFLRGLFETLRRWGFMDGLYLDRGPGFISEDTALVCMGRPPIIPVILGEARYPEGHGKVEAFNKTALHAVLRNLDRRPEVDPDCAALELRIQHWMRETYNHEPHGSLGHRTPAEVFLGDERDLRFPESEEALRERFVVTADYRVKHDHVVEVGERAYEMPRGTAGMRVTLQKRFLDSQVLYLHHGQLIVLHQVDLVANARDRRGTRPAKQDPDVPLPPSAADLAFARDLGSIVDADGGYPERSEGSADAVRGPRGGTTSSSSSRRRTRPRKDRS